MTPGQLQTLLGRVWPGWRVRSQLGKSSCAQVYEIGYVSAGRGGTMTRALKVIPVDAQTPAYGRWRASGCPDRLCHERFTAIARQISQALRATDALPTTPRILRPLAWQVVRSPFGPGWLVLIMMRLAPRVDRAYVPANFPPKVYLQLAEDLCDALSLIHRAGIIHGNVVPGNLFALDDGHFALADVGLRQACRGLYRGGFAPDEDFASPQRIMGQAAGWADYVSADLYALGINLYRMGNAGTLPMLFRGVRATTAQRRAANLRRMRGEPLALPMDLPETLGAVILRACDYEPGVRYASALELKAAIFRAVAPPERRMAPPARRRRARADRLGIAAGIVAAMLLLCAIALLTSALRATPSRSAAFPTQNGGATIASVLREVAPSGGP